ncbi:hypothetical protein NKR23_g10628 [Pleurostoma richardsiae]|uniref:Uncharacterized protein n=1 Tax=Pleurostoma richardsiae TaxID=41990 RepID=A0AA38R4Z3_9PEZI|nr:hypothetical protein NKR23_g10628 [Pleurostoma richardsiae]
MTEALTLPSLETPMRMSPLAFLQAVLIAWLTGELSDAMAGRVTPLGRRRAHRYYCTSAGGRAGLILKNNTDIQPYPSHPFGSHDKWWQRL